MHKKTLKFFLCFCRLL